MMDALPYSIYGQSEVPASIPHTYYPSGHTSTKEHSLRTLLQNIGPSVGPLLPFRKKREIYDDPIAELPIPAPSVVAHEIVESAIKELTDRLAHPEVNALIKEILVLPRPLLGVALNVVREINDAAINSAIKASKNAIADNLRLFEQFVGEGHQKGRDQLMKRDFQESQPLKELQLEDKPVEIK